MKKILFLMTAVLVIAGCSKSEDGKLTLSANQVSLYSGDTKQVTVNDNATWSSKSEFVAEVSEDGIIKGNHVGKTIITATSDNGEALCEVVVNAKYSTYTEPVLEFGVDKATVKAKEKRTILEDKTSTLGYRGENSAVKSVAYLFENGKLTSSAIALSYSYTEEIAKFLSERYQVIGKDSDGAYTSSIMIRINIIWGLDYPLKVVSLWWCMFLSLLNQGVFKLQICRNLSLYWEFNI